jgi:nucleoside-diphosphate-sugar epimerase
VEAETAVAAGDWSSLILRPAAIYGPGRGLQESVRAGTFRVPEGGGGSISRIHVEDLASHEVVGLLSSVTGAFPVADEYPCPSLEVARFAAELLQVPLPPAVPHNQLPETLQGDRRVDGSAVRRRLGLGLRFPTYREGVRQALL